MEKVLEVLNKLLQNKKVIVTAAVVFGLFIFVSSFVSVYNTQATLGNTYEMKVKSNEAEFDNMWKKITQVTQIPAEKKEAFRSIFVEYAEARTPENAGQVMSWIKESAPTLDLSIYDNVMNIVTGSRDAWTMRQTELVDIARQHNQNLVLFPRNLFLGMFFDKIDPKVITSGRTQEAFVSGRDEDVELFKKK